MRYILLVIRVLIDLIPAGGALLELILGKAKAQRFQEQLDRALAYIKAINDVLQCYLQANAEGKEDIAEDALEAVESLALDALPDPPMPEAPPGFPPFPSLPKQ